eukprot:768805-Hanusia_phi.AAC.6
MSCQPILALRLVECTSSRPSPAMPDGPNRQPQTEAPWDNQQLQHGEKSRRTVGYLSFLEQIIDTGTSTPLRRSLLGGDERSVSVGLYPLFLPHSRGFRSMAAPAPHTARPDGPHRPGLV